ncbi:MAG TPA: hypothetical protein VFY26_10120 [Anaerolineales bacterium]|nr:hypothetical protein [Anaerolineales bacterium]
MTARCRRLLHVMVAVLILGLTLFSINRNDVRAAPVFTTKTLLLYDAASGAIPSAPLMGFLDFPQNTASLSYSDGTTVLDTTAAGSDTYAGWVATAAASPGFPILDSTAGFQVYFTVRVEDETHTSDHRAGFSFIVLGQDGRGIELGFWEDQIWAQADDRTGGLFSRAESIPFPVSAGLTEYQVTVMGDVYSLAANGETILTGPLREYSAFSGFPDPYETPNFLFLGDNTTSAQARARLRFVSILGTEPVAASPTATISTTPPGTEPSMPLPGTSTSIPSPTPAGTARDLCPSGWVFLIVMAAAAFVTRKYRNG